MMVHDPDPLGDRDFRGARESEKRVDAVGHTHLDDCHDTHHGWDPCLAEEERKEEWEMDPDRVPELVVLEAMEARVDVSFEVDERAGVLPLRLTPRVRPMFGTRRRG